MQIQDSIEARLRARFDPVHLEVVNESGMHNVAPGAETHFRVVVVSAAFEGKPRVAQHRLIYETLEAERAAGVHALGIQTLTPAEHEAATAAIVESPPCLGGDGTRG